jgi:hypothetical protein
MSCKTSTRERCKKEAHGRGEECDKAGDKALQDVIKLMVEEK